MILTKAFHAEVWAIFRCVRASSSSSSSAAAVTTASAADSGGGRAGPAAANAAKPKTPAGGVLETVAKFHLYDAGQYVLRRGQPLERIYALKGRPSGEFGATPELVEMFLDDKDAATAAAAHNTGARTCSGGAKAAADTRHQGQQPSLHVCVAAAATAEYRGRRCCSCKHHAAAATALLCV
jgi:hypothetical protein